MAIGERIIALRKERGMSQGQLATALGVSRQAVSKWENEQSAPDTVKLIQLAEVLNTDVEFLATGNVPQKEVPPPQVVEVIKEVERIVPVEKLVDRIVPVEKTVEKVVVQKRVRVKYVRNPVEYVLVGIAGLVAGVIIGLLI